jgi:hypothetical protein
MEEVAGSDDAHATLSKPIEIGLIDLDPPSKSGQKKLITL